MCNLTTDYPQKEINPQNGNVAAETQSGFFVQQRADVIDPYFGERAVPATDRSNKKPSSQLPRLAPGTPCS